MLFVACIDDTKVDKGVTTLPSRPYIKLRLRLKYMTGQRLCTVTEIDAHRQYLLTTPVSYLADASVQLQWNIGQLNFPNDVQSFESWFSELGGEWKNAGRPADRFLLAELAERFLNGTCPDKKMERVVADYIALLEAGKLQVVITLTTIDGQLRVADGNKRAIAILAHNRHYRCTGYLLIPK